MEHVSIWGTPFPAILNQKNSTGSAGGAKNSQNGVFLEVPKYQPLIVNNERNNIRKSILPYKEFMELK